MTPTPKALAEAARVLRGLSVARELLVFLRKNDFEGFTLSGNAATMDDNERAVIAEYDEAIAATAGDDTALSAVAAWLETQGWQPIEKARRDGTEYLVWRLGASLRTARYMTSMEEGDGAWIIARSIGSNPVAFAYEAPTHFYALPAPPETSNAE